MNQKSCFLSSALSRCVPIFIGMAVNLIAVVAIGAQVSDVRSGASEPVELRPVPRMDLRSAARDGGLFGDYWWASRFAEHAMRKREMSVKVVDLVMLGDSIMHFWEERHQESWNSFTNGMQVLNAGYAGDRTQHVIWRILHGELDGFEAKTIVLMIGTNNNTDEKTDPANVASGVRRIVELLRERQPKAKIILHPIFPRGVSADSERHAAPRMRNEKTNQLLKAFADANSDVIWVDFNRRLLGPDGWVPRTIIGDEIHPTDKGYEIWREELAPFLKGVSAP